MQDACKHLTGNAQKNDLVARRIAFTPQQAFSLSDDALECSKKGSKHTSLQPIEFTLMQNFSSKWPLKIKYGKKYNESKVSEDASSYKKINTIENSNNSDIDAAIVNEYEVLEKLNKCFLCEKKEEQEIEIVQNQLNKQILPCNNKATYFYSIFNGIHSQQLTLGPNCYDINNSKQSTCSNLFNKKSNSCDGCIDNKGTTEVSMYQQFPHLNLKFSADLNYKGNTVHPSKHRKASLYKYSRKSAYHHQNNDAKRCDRINVVDSDYNYDLNCKNGINSTKDSLPKNYRVNNGAALPFTLSNRFFNEYEYKRNTVKQVCKNLHHKLTKSYSSIMFTSSNLNKDIRKLSGNKNCYANLNQRPFHILSNMKIKDEHYLEYYEKIRMHNVNVHEAFASIPKACKVRTAKNIERHNQFLLNNFENGSSDHHCSKITAGNAFPSFSNLSSTRKINNSRAVALQFNRIANTNKKKILNEFYVSMPGLCNENVDTSQLHTYLKYAVDFLVNTDFSIFEKAPFKRYNMPMKIEDVKKQTLVLDLDETLIHCSPCLLKYPPDMNVRLHLSSTDKGYIYFRPFVHLFIRMAAKQFELVVYTASQQYYADQVIDRLDPKGEYIKHRLYRNHCIAVNNGYVKDLRQLGRSMEKILLIDNSPISMSFQLDNGILVKYWTATNYKDNELLDLLNCLTNEVCKQPNIPLYVAQKYQLRKWINFLRYNLSSL